MPDTSTPIRHTPHPPTQTTPPRWVWVLLMFLVSVIVGGVAALLAYASEPSVPRAILTGGGSFAGSFALLLAVAHYTGGDRS